MSLSPETSAVWADPVRRIFLRSNADYSCGAANKSKPPKRNSRSWRKLCIQGSFFSDFGERLHWRHFEPQHIALLHFRCNKATRPTHQPRPQRTTVPRGSTSPAVDFVLKWATPARLTTMKITTRFYQLMIIARDMAARNDAARPNGLRSSTVTTQATTPSSRLTYHIVLDLMVLPSSTL